MFTSGSSGSKMNRTPPAKAATKAASTEEESDCGLTSDCGPGYGGIRAYELETDCGLTSGEGNEHNEDVVLTATCPDKRKRTFKGTPERNVKRPKDTTLSPPEVGTSKVGERILVAEDWYALQEQMEHVYREIRAIKRMMESSRNIRSDITTRTAALVLSSGRLVDTAEELEESLKPVAQVHKLAQRNTETQTDAWEGNSQTPQTCRVKEVLHRGKGFAPLAGILDTAWPEECFQNVRKIGDENKATTGSDTLVVITEERGSAEQLQRWRKSLPDWNELERSLTPDNGIDFLRIATETTSSGGVRKERVQHVFAGICKGLTGDTPEWEDLFSLMQGMKSLATEHGIKELVVSIAREVDLERVMKTVQYCFNECDINLHIDGGQRGRGSRKVKEEELLIVKATDGRNYSQIVRGITSKVDIGKIGVKVKSLKQSQSGDLLVRVEGGRGGANALKEEICGKDDKAQVTIRENRAVLFVTDIVVGTESEELRTILSAEMGDPSVRVASLKDTKDGNLVATVEVSPQTAKTWSSRGRVKVGWVSCRVRGKPEIQRCFRCLEFGHMRRDCQGEDKSNVCIRCGRADGHRASQCEGVVYCGRCKVGGHRQDSRASPTSRSCWQPPALGSNGSIGAARELI